MVRFLLHSSDGIPAASCQRPSGDGCFPVAVDTTGNAPHTSRYDIDIGMWVFPKIGVPQNGWFIMENPIKMDDLGVPLFSETPILVCGYVNPIYCYYNLAFYAFLHIFLAHSVRTQVMASTSIHLPNYHDARRYLKPEKEEYQGCATLTFQPFKSRCVLPP